MKQPWMAEVEISEGLACVLVARQFPQLDPVRAEVLGVGWDNAAMLVNGEYVFRFPRRALGARLLESEIRAMPTIAPLLPARAPDHSFVGDRSPEFDWPFAGYQVIPGKSVCRARLSGVQRLDLAEPLARFVRALHRIPSDVVRTAGVKPDPLGRFDMHHRIAQTIEKLSHLRANRVIEDVEPLLAILEATPIKYTPRTDTLVHGDLYSRHVLMDDFGKLSGIIDWGDIHLGDPAQDLAIAMALFGPGARERFASAYGALADVAWTMARFRALNHTANVLHYAHDIGDDDLLCEMKLALVNVASS